MGNHQLTPSNIQILRTQNWVQAGQDQQNALFSNVNPYRRRLLANVVTHELIQQYELNFITQQDYNSYITQLSYRQVVIKSNNNNLTPNNWQNHNYIYPIRYFVNKSKNQMCTTIHTGYLYADKVDLRLKQINDIPFQDLLYMYKATLNGFKNLYQKVGYFDIVQEMIFITKRGQVKVWMNANLAKNYPNYQKTSYSSNIHHNLNAQHTYSQRQPIQNIYGSQADMIRKLIIMIQKNSDQFVSQQQQASKVQNELLSEYLQDKNLIDKLSFQHCIDQFQSYLNQNNLHCPDYMKSIPQLFTPDQFEQNNNQPNYQQSHVNEITTQHLTQMKKKFQPMETIHQDQKHNSNKTTNKSINPNQNKVFHESLVAKYTPQSFTNQKDQPTFRNDQRQVVRPGHSPFTDLRHSRYSHKSNNTVNNQYAHLQRSTNSNTINSPHFNQKPNSVSNLNYRSNENMALVHSPQIIQQKLMIPYQQNVLNGGSLFVQPQFHQQNDMSQRIVMMSPPPSFRVMGQLNNQPIVHQNHMPFQQQFIANHFPNQYFNLPHPFEIQPTQKPQVPNHNKMNNLSAINQNVGKVRNVLITDNNNSVLLNGGNINTKVNNNSSQVFEYNQQNGLSSPYESSLNSNRNSSLINKKLGYKQVDRVNKVDRQSNGNEKSKMRYYKTIKDSYEIDQQIANDLQKFLGLKVN